MLTLRSLTNKEQKLLEKKIRQKTLPARIYQRYQIIWLRTKKTKPKDICNFLQIHPHTMRLWIQRFNAQGFRSFEQRAEVGGRPRQIAPETRTKIIQAALSRPKDLGYPFTQWSLMKLKEHLESKQIVTTISPEGIRKILKANRLSYQRTKTWKQSPDPDFEQKKT